MKKRAFAVLFLALLVCPSLSFASSWYDGIPQAAIDWIGDVAVNAESYSPGTITHTFGDTTVSINLVQQTEEDWTGIVAGSVSVSGKGSRSYSGEAGRDQLLAELAAAVASDAQTNAATSESFAYHSPDSGENSAPLVSSETPVASADRAGLRIIENILIPQAEPKAQKEKKAAELAAGKPKVIGGTLTYEEFEYYEIKGKTYEVLGGFEKSFDNNIAAGFFAPISYVDVDGGDWTKLGVTGYLKKNFPRENYDFSLGFNVSGEQAWMNVEDVSDSFAYGAGPMASVTFFLKDVQVAFGGNLAYMANSEYDAVSIMTSGLNIGIPIKNNLALNLTAYRNDNFDSDNGYWELGGSGTCMVSDAFGLTLGIKTVTGLDNFDSNSYHFGGTWRF
jgi:hypothetical protein